MVINYGVKRITTVFWHLWSTFEFKSAHNYLNYLVFIARFSFDTTRKHSLYLYLMRAY